MANVPAQSVSGEIRKRQSGEPRLLSLGQQRLWFVDQLSPHSPAYNCPLLTRVEGPLNIEALRQAHDAFVMRHEALRTVCINRGGTPMPVLLRKATVPMTRFDLRDLNESEREAESRRIAEHEGSRPFDLAKDVLFRAAVIQLADESYVLVHSFSHMAFEGTSIPVFCEEVGELYRGFDSGQPAELPELPFQYADYVLWQSQTIQDNRLERLKEYWKQQLAGASTVLHLPTDFPRPSIHSLCGNRFRWRLASDLLAQANEFFRSERISAFRGWCAAFTVLLYAYTGQEDILLGSPFLPPRLPPGVEKLVGFFVNTVVLRVHLKDSPNFRELTARVDQVVRAATKHAALDLDRVVQAVNPPRDSSRTPLFQVNFRVAPAPFPVLRLPNLKVSRPEYMDTRTSKFDLALDIEASEGSCYFEYSSALFKEATVLQMIQDFQNVARDLLSNAGSPCKQCAAVLEIQKRIGVLGHIAR